MKVCADEKCRHLEMDHPTRLADAVVARGFPYCEVCRVVCSGKWSMVEEAQDSPAAPSTAVPDETVAVDLDAIVHRFVRAAALIAAGGGSRLVPNAVMNDAEKYVEWIDRKEEVDE